MKAGKSPKKCGDFGGIARGGGPCGRRVKDGRCDAHSEEASAELGEAKEEFLRQFGTGIVSIQAAGLAVDKSPATLWRMRQDDPDFDRAVLAIQEDVDDIRLGMVEDAVFKRIIEGTASGVLTIFYLINRGKGRWKHVQHIEHSGSIGILSFVQQLSDEQVDRLRTLPEVERREELGRLALSAGVEL